MHKTSIDTPLSNVSEDLLGRENIVNLIVDSINEFASEDHPCVVYGIYGKWGEGKTSLLNFVKQRLLEHGRTDKLSLVEYNPWLVNNDESLLREFFKSLLKHPDEKVRELFKKYGSLAILASKSIVNAIVPKLGDTIAEGIELAKSALEDSEDSLAELKKRVARAIISSKQHLLVLIDDVDRLDREELHTVLRLIRQVADFPNCIYVVAMDVEMVAKSIGNYHGEGTTEDGRKYLDKIVQIPITLPHISEAEMFTHVQKELSSLLGDYVPVETVSSIANKISPFLPTIRSLKRFCNQLKFVLPHLKDEVNIEDLCLLEAIKSVSNEAYDRIYESRPSLHREADTLESMIESTSSSERVEERFKLAIDYIVENITGSIKFVVEKTIHQLFTSCSYDRYVDLDRKRLVTPEYFMKYFVQKVPHNVIPDSIIISLNDADIDSATLIINDWAKRYPTSEIKRATIQFVRSQSSANEQSTAASLVAKALSASSLAKGFPPFTLVDPIDISAFVPIAIIQRYMFLQNIDTVGVQVLDMKVLDETLAFIFSNSDMNYCMNFLASSKGILESGSYDGRDALLILINRFKNLGFEEQFRFSKFLLTEIFRYWQRLDVDSFNSFAAMLFTDDSIPYLRVFDKLIDGTDDHNDLNLFVKLFYLQIPLINNRIKEDATNNPLGHNSVKLYSANFRIIISNYGLSQRQDDDE